MKKIINASFVIGGAIAFLAAAGGSAGGYTRVLDPQIAFLLFVVGMLIGAIVFIAGLIDAARHGISIRSIGLALGTLPAAALVIIITQSTKFPAINDVTTDTVFPPEFKHASTLEANADRNMEFPLEFKEQVETAYSDLAPQPKLTSLDDAYIDALKIIKGISSWEVTSNRLDGNKTFIEGTVTSEVFGFVDDFVIRIVETNNAGCVVDMRSKSRMGKGDFGKNAEHIRTFMKLFK